MARDNVAPTNSRRDTSNQSLRSQYVSWPSALKMLKLEQITPNASIRGILPDSLAGGRFEGRLRDGFHVADVFDMTCGRRKHGCTA